MCVLLLMAFLFRYRRAPKVRVQTFTKFSHRTMDLLGKSTESTFYLKGLGIAGGMIACVLIVFFQHISLHSDAIFNPIDTCTQPPLGCWDGLNKPHYKCVTYAKDTVLRSGVIARAGTRNCYKSVYFNIDSTAMYMFCWLLVWCIVTVRTVENGIHAIATNSLRPKFAAAILLSIPSVWYACIIPAHYLNDRYFPMFWSQLFFSLTELYCSVICAIHVSKSNPTLKNALLVMCGTATAHSLQILLDEPLLISRHFGASLRNIFFFAGDVTIFLSGWSLVSKINRARSIIIGVALVELLIFHTFFADEASFTIF